MEPNEEAKTIPMNLLSFPRYWEIMVSGIRKRTIETKMSIIKNAGRIATNFRQAIFSAVAVFFRSRITEIKTANPVAIYK